MSLVDVFILEALCPPRFYMDGKGLDMDKVIATHVLLFFLVLSVVELFKLS